MSETSEHPDLIISEMPSHSYCFFETVLTFLELRGWKCELSGKNFYFIEKKCY